MRINTLFIVSIAALMAILGAPVVGESSAEAREVNRHNVSNREAAPNRVRDDNLMFFTVGPAWLPHVEANELPVNLSIGLRRELDNFALEVGLNVYLAVGNEETDNFGIIGTGTLMGHYFFNGIADSSPYLGLGMGYGGMAVNKHDDYYTGAGLHGKLALGFEAMRSSTIRFCLQADATFPFYDLEHDFGADDTENKPLWAPSFGLSIGGAWSKTQNTVTIRRM